MSPARRTRAVEVDDTPTTTTYSSVSAPADPEPGTFIGEADPPPARVAIPTGVRASVNAWWCPTHDRAMPLTDPPTPCDVGGEVPADFADEVTSGSTT